MNEIDRAEFIQALNAFLIPTSLFVACLLGAAGTFLIREGYGLGWFVVGGALLIIVWAFVAFCNFQNKLRASGKMKDPYDTPAPDYEQEEAKQAVDTDITSRLLVISDDSDSRAIRN